LIDIASDQVIGDAQLVEPKAAELSEDAALIGDARGKHPIEGADSIGAHQQQLVAEILNIAHFAAANR